MRQTTFGAVLLLFLLMPFGGLGQPQSSDPEESVWLQAPVAIGMDRATVMEKLLKSYKLEKSGDDPTEDSWQILEKKASDASPTNLVGLVSFRDGKVVWASRQWGSFEGSEAQQLARSLAGLISNLNDEGKRAAVVEAHTRVAPGHEFQTIRLTFGKKRVMVHISRSRDGDGIVSIQETVER